MAITPPTRITSDRIGEISPRALYKKQLKADKPEKKSDGIPSFFSFKIVNWRKMTNIFSTTGEPKQTKDAG